MEPLYKLLAGNLTPEQQAGQPELGPTQQNLPQRQQCEQAQQGRHSWHATEGRHQDDANQKHQRPKGPAPDCIHHFTDGNVRTTSGPCFYAVQ